MHGMVDNGYRVVRVAPAFIEPRVVCCNKSEVVHFANVTEIVPCCRERGPVLVKAHRHQGTERLRHHSDVLRFDFEPVALPVVLSYLHVEFMDSCKYLFDIFSVIKVFRGKAGLYVDDVIRLGLEVPRFNKSGSEGRLYQRSVSRGCIPRPVIQL